jgi:hypothetical protein
LSTSTSYQLGTHLQPRCTRTRMASWPTKACRSCAVEGAGRRASRRRCQAWSFDNLSLVWVTALSESRVCCVASMSSWRGLRSRVCALSSVARIWRALLLHLVWIACTCPAPLLILWCCHLCSAHHSRRPRTPTALCVCVCTSAGVTTSPTASGITERFRVKRLPTGWLDTAW